MGWGEWRSHQKDFELLVFIPFVRRPVGTHTCARTRARAHARTHDDDDDVIIWFLFVCLILPRCEQT